MKAQKMISLPIVMAIAAVASALGAVTTSAETVQIPVGQQAQDKQSMARPRAGMNQEQVKAQYGNPLDWTNPVGDPPITKWFYDEFIVVFEYDQVLHSVLVHTPQPSDSGSQQQPASTAEADDDSALNVLSRSQEN